MEYSPPGTLAGTAAHRNDQHIRYTYLYRFRRFLHPDRWLRWGTLARKHRN